MALAVINHHPRIQRLRRSTRVRAREAAARTYELARQTPMPSGLRTALRDRLAWRPGLQTVEIDQLLLGGQNRMPAEEFAAAMGDPLWCSTRVSEGPHADLLQRAQYGPMTDEEILESPYAQMARTVVTTTGQFFGAMSDSEIVDHVRELLAAHAGTGELSAAPKRSAPGAPVEVAPIRDSDCFQVIDGHHRVARAAVSGQQHVQVRVRRIPVSTPVQSMLGAMSWIGGQVELYQPVALPEVATWPTVRRCADRFESMQRLLAEVGMGPGTYLDVASCYGWFVAAMARRGHTAEGVEQDPLAPDLGQAVMGLQPGMVHTGEAVSFLRDQGRTWDVVSCFSLLHHFVLGRSEDSSEALLAALDRATDRVLFIDTGQEHEAWFAESLAGWDTEAVAEFLRSRTSFDRVIDLGPDLDDRPPYSGNYGRHLFACVRDEPRRSGAS